MGGSAGDAHGDVHSTYKHTLTPVYVVVMLEAYVVFTNASIASHSAEAKTLLSCARGIAVVCIDKVVLASAWVMLESSFLSDAWDKKPLMPGSDSTHRIKAMPAIM